MDPTVKEREKRKRILKISDGETAEDSDEGSRKNGS